MRHWIVGLGLLGVLFLPRDIVAEAAEAAEAAEDAVETISVAEIRRGQTGYGLSVFAGTVPERFELEVLGVLRNPTAGNNAIIARLRGKGLEETGVIAGMSGSPVYIEDRLAGAVAFSWGFSTGAIAGITPIREMRDVAVSAPRQPAGWVAQDPRALFAPPSGPVTLETLEALQPRRYPAEILHRHLRQLSGLSGPVGPTASAGPEGPLGETARPAFHWSLGGFGEGSRQLFAASLGPQQALGVTGALLLASGAEGEAEAAAEAMDLELSPGAAVSAVLVQGDLRLAAGATVTDRQGEGVLAFGHPFLGFGPISIPMAAAEVVTVVPSLSNSFKVSNMGPIVGAFLEDRQAAVYGRMGAEARTIPVRIDLSGEGLGGEMTYRMRVADLNYMTPTLVALSLLGSLDGTGHGTGDQSLDLEATLRLAKYGDVELRQSFEGPNSGTEAAVFMITVLGALLGSEYEAVQLEEASVKIHRSGALRTASLVEAFTPRTTVRPGETIPLWVELQPHRGERYRQRLEVTIPEDQPAGPYFLMVADGATADAARLTVTPTAPSNFDQVLEFVRTRSSNRELHILGLVAAPGLVIGGEALPQLPGSVRASRAAAQPVAASATQLAIVQDVREGVDVPLSGVVRVDLQVERR
jgi:hypothetical protein